MSHSQLQSLRHEVQNYVDSCEQLVSVAIDSPNYPPFSQVELQIVDYYADEVATMLAQLIWRRRNRRSL
jgi:hypothetical protein